MLCGAVHIEQPYSGEYEEKVYDIADPWNSREWTWVRFSDENGMWCGVFRGRYRGTVFSEKTGIAVVLTSDYMYVLDSETMEIIDYCSQPRYVDITVSPLGDILVTDDYGIDLFTDEKIMNMKRADIPVCTDQIRFAGWKGNILKIKYHEFPEGNKESELYLDCTSVEWSEI